MKSNKRAFTLIELLVVVLIIGTLAAVAVPQYQKAVFKSRVANIWPLLKTLRDARAVCKLSKGDDCLRRELDVEVPCPLLPGSTECRYWELSDLQNSFEAKPAFYDCVLMDQHIEDHYMQFWLCGTQRYCGDDAGSGLCAKKGIGTSGEYFADGFDIYNVN